MMTQSLHHLHLIPAHHFDTVQALRNQLHELEAALEDARNDYAELFDENERLWAQNLRLVREAKRLRELLLEAS